ncbi:SDR family NAD(P)-dependent oxidoreductase [Parahaliea aestuarii]|uniref:SDR family NAD(P)-dependent oxidoreductase n=1 Tax=Parahaliea aestuarii TaxID=1852021 RepID=A0A5C9A1T1_9GAMM|nr:SDR family NAD(P)-dependent oxidoreductase [Parahaliea aestuarii]TXS94728.1 SDR family NAD(P)-dependent oxidoreductase [Parahaliea aestuarii]
MPYTSGKIAAVTGAGSGIGRALARQLHSEGCALYLSDVDEVGLAETRASLTGSAAVDTRPVDVADRAAVNAWAADIGAREGHIDIVINNAGVGLSDRVDEGRYEDVQWLMGINFWGVVHGTMAFLPLLKGSSQGHLVNLSSIFGMIGVPTQSAYNAAKFAVRGYTEALRLEMEGSSVHVCCVHPGGIRTNIARRARSASSEISADQRGQAFEQFARTSPESAAAQIIRAVEKRQKRLLIGGDAKFISVITRLFPVRYPSLMPGLGKVGDALGKK